MLISFKNEVKGKNVNLSRIKSVLLEKTIYSTNFWSFLLWLPFIFALQALLNGAKWALAAALVASFLGAAIAKFFFNRSKRNSFIQELWLWPVLVAVFSGMAGFSLGAQVLIGLVGIVVVILLSIFILVDFS